MDFAYRQTLHLIQILLPNLFNIWHLKILCCASSEFLFLFLFLKTFIWSCLLCLYFGIPSVSGGWFPFVCLIIIHSGYVYILLYIPEYYIHIFQSIWGWLQRLGCQLAREDPKHHLKKGDHFWYMGQCKCGWTLVPVHILVLQPALSLMPVCDTNNRHTEWLKISNSQVANLHNCVLPSQLDLLPLQCNAYSNAISTFWCPPLIHSPQTNPCPFEYTLEYHA